MLVNNQSWKEENNLSRIGYKNQPKVPSCNGSFSSFIFILLENIINNENLFNMQEVLNGLCKRYVIACVFYNFL